MRRAILAFCGIALLMAFAVGSVSAANSTMIALQGSVPATETDWTQALTFDKFDTSLGTLLSVRFDLTAYLTGTMGFEHTSGTKGATITMTLSELISMSKGSNTLITAAPSSTEIKTATVYDGVPNYEGTSGWHSNGISKSVSSTSLLSSADVGFNDFKGPGQITLDLAALGTSGHAGSGNMVAYFVSNAAADYKVTYEYATVPEPGALCAMASGLIGFVGFAVRRRK